MLTNIPRFLIILVLFLTPYLAQAGLVINEIMYDLLGADSTNGKSREWVEIFNNGGDVFVDASSWRINDGVANRTINGEVNFTISAGSFVILAGDKDTFLSDHTGFSGIVYDTGIASLNNTGANLKLLDQDGNTVDSITYNSSQGGAGDGNSLQKISSSWSGALSTPGEANEEDTSPPQTTPENSSSSGSGNGEEANTSTSSEQIIKTDIFVKSLVMTGIPFEIKATTLGHYGENISYGKYFWNFGDGTSSEIQVGSMEKISHTYFYPGEYTISLEYYLTHYADTPEAKDKMVIKAITPDISISGVGDENDFFIELSNSSTYEADISRWILASSSKNFILPKNTILSSKQKLTLSPKVTGFSIEDKNSLTFLTPQMSVVASYKLQTSTRVSSPTKTTPTSQNITEPSLAVSTSTDGGEELSASAIASVGDGGIDFSINIPTIIFVFFVGFSAVTVYFLRQERSKTLPGEDFELLDE